MPEKGHVDIDVVGCAFAVGFLATVAALLTAVVMLVVRVLR